MIDKNDFEGPAGGAGEYLAAYGTLMSGQANPVDPAVLARMRRCGMCLISGALYVVDAVPPYPALVMAPEGGMVRGELFRLEEGAADILAVLDDYEAFDPADPAGSDYVRQAISVVQPGGEGAVAWVYVFNHDPVRLGLARIVDGDWVAYRAGVD